MAPSASVSRAPTDSIDCAIFFPSHLETSSFLNWMEFKVRLADFQSEHGGFSQSLPVSWAVIHGTSEFTFWSNLTCWFLFIAFWWGNKAHQPGPDSPASHHSRTYYPLYEVSGSFALHFTSCWLWVILLLVRTSTIQWGRGLRTAKPFASS